jgi:hypothetical protein
VHSLSDIRAQLSGIPVCKLFPASVRSFLGILCAAFWASVRGFLCIRVQLFSASVVRLFPAYRCAAFPAPPFAQLSDHLVRRFFPGPTRSISSVVCSVP